jgi:endonuclease/exonuclease/phosphatase family metal-dependent hydrolase
VTKVFLPAVANGGQQRRTVCSRAPKARSQVNVATYNVGYDGNNAWIMAPIERVQKIGGQLLAHDVEIVALQEVMHEGDNMELGVFSHWFTGWQWFAEAHNRRNHYLNVILTAHPIVQGSERTHTIVSRNGRNDRVNVSVQVRTPAGVMRVWSIHTRFEEPDDGTAQLMRGVKLVADSEPGIPVLIMGDFNTQRSNVLSIAKDAELRPNATTVGRIDHILAHGLEIVESCAAPRPGVPGEHDPIFATVTF